MLFDKLILFITLKMKPMLQEPLYIERIRFIGSSRFLIVPVLRDIILIGQKRPYTPQLQDALLSIQDSQFIPR